MDRTRSGKAAALADDAGQWLKIRDRKTGRPRGFGIRSESNPDRYHLVNSTTCCCEWAQHHSTAYSPCKHVLAVRLHNDRNHELLATSPSAA